MIVTPARFHTQACRQGRSRACDTVECLKCGHISLSTRNNGASISRAGQACQTSPVPRLRYSHCTRHPKGFMSESFRLASSIQAASGTRESVVVLIDVMNAGIWKELCENAWSFIFAVNKRETGHCGGYDGSRQATWVICLPVLKCTSPSTQTRTWT